MKPWFSHGLTIRFSNPLNLLGLFLSIRSCWQSSPLCFLHMPPQLLLFRSRSIAFLLLVASNLFVFAQQPAESGRPGAEPSGAPYSSRPAIGTITGVVHDSISGQALEYATVALYSINPDSLIGGSITDQKGRFTLTGIRPGAHRLEISFLGFTMRRLGPYAVRPDRPLVDIGVVQLSEAGETLEAVQITGERSYMQLGIDRKVYTIEKDLIAQSGDALDAMRNIPSLDIGVEGNVSLRGSENVNILIDGKPSGLTGSSRAAILEQLPASSIESIEIITNPSARFNPDGTAGIINIVMKKDRKLGMSGGVSVGVGTNYKYNGSTNFNYRTKDFNVFGNYGYRYNNAFSLRSTYRETDTGEELLVLDQDFNGDGQSQSHLAKLGADWFVNPKTTLSLGGLFSTDNRVSEGSTFYRYLTPASGLLEGLSVQGEDDDEEGWNTDLDFRFDRLFDVPGQQLTVDARYSYRNDTELEANLLTDYLINGSPVTSMPFTRDNSEASSNQIVTLQTDYIHPHMVNSGGKEVESWRLETGMQVILRQSETDYQSVIQDSLTGAFILDESVSNVFRLEESILSAYGSFRKRWSRWGMQAGLRVEQALTDPQLISTGEVFDNDYLSFFPSMYVSRDLGKDQELQWNYSRRINRPSRWALNPFIDNSDPQNIRIGNPDLQPEYVHSVEMNFAKSWPSGNALTSSLFFRQTDGVIRSIRTVDSLGISTQVYNNFSWQRDYGLELISVLNLTDWLKMTASGSVFRANFEAGAAAEGLTNTNYSWNIKTNANVNLPKEFYFQTSFRYRGPGLTAQGTFVAVPELDAALQKDFLAGKASLSLRVSDILDKQRFGYTLEDGNFFQDSFYKRESRIAWLTFNYKFGKQSFERKRNSGGPGDGGDFSPDMGM
ncbi:MAG: TonB-dependent receptor [Bacteroidetes bacterium]|nr:TonB-dependent receptor [Bacteroidota bacterium]